MKDVIEKLGISKGPWKFIDGEHWMIRNSNGNDFQANYPYDHWTSDNKQDWILQATAPEMLEALIESLITYEVQIDVFKDTIVDGNIKGSWLVTPKNIKNAIEKATNKSWDEIKELIK